LSGEFEENNEKHQSKWQVSQMRTSKTQTQEFTAISAHYFDNSDDYDDAARS
jgi:hypothetical protein